MIKLTEEQIINGQNEAYLKAGHNAYFGNGFNAGVDFALKQVNKLPIHIVSNCADDLEYSLYGQVVNLKEKVKKLEFMIENGLGEEDMINDITYPSGD